MSEDVDAALDRGPRAGAVRGMGDDQVSAPVGHGHRGPDDVHGHDHDGVGTRPRTGEELHHVGAIVELALDDGGRFLGGRRLRKPDGQDVVRTPARRCETRAGGEDRRSGDLARLDASAQRQRVLQK